MRDVDTTARTGHALDAVDGTLAVTAVLEDDGNLLAGRTRTRGFLGVAHVGDVAFELEDFGDVLLELARGHEGNFVAGEGRVTDTRQHVCDRIGHHGITSLPW